MKHYIHLDLTIRFSSRWHTGSGEGSFVTDSLVRKDANNRPFIPGSTLKGVVRQSCEKLNTSLGFPKPWDPHQPDRFGGDDFIPLHCMPSPVEQIFGTHYESGELFFRDANLPPDSVCKPFSRNRVARHRILMTTKDKQLFNAEYSPPSDLRTRVDGWHTGLPAFDENYPPYAYCMLIGGILAIDRIGGHKSTGSGHLRDAISIDKAYYNDSPIRIDEVLELLNVEFYMESKGIS